MYSWHRTSSIGLILILPQVTAGSSQPTHGARASSSFAVACVAPRPIYDLAVEQQLSSLGVVTALKITWRGCDRAGECCCPCSYEIEKDGVTIATTNYLNYTYTPTLAQIGTNVAFSVHVVDSVREILSAGMACKLKTFLMDGQHKTRSSENTCGIQRAVTIKSSNLDYLVVLLVILGIMALPALIVLMEKLRQKNVLLTT